MLINPLFRNALSFFWKPRCSQKPTITIDGDPVRETISEAVTISGSVNLNGVSGGIPSFITWFCYQARDNQADKSELDKVSTPYTFEFEVKLREGENLIIVDLMHESGEPVSNGVVVIRKPVE